MNTLVKAPVTANFAPDSLEAMQSRWRRAAAQLRTAQLTTSLWKELHQALAAEAQGRHTLVSMWLDQTEEAMLKAWDSYDDSSVFQEEVTVESILGHSLLREGTEAWLEALALLRENFGQVDSEAVLAKAEEGQRLLVALQVAEHNTEDLTVRFMRAWTN